MLKVAKILSLYPFASRRGVARVLSTFLCAITIVIRPFSRLGGSTAFLVLTLKELVFSCQSTLAQQIELTSLNILGALCAIGISTFAKFLAVNTSTDKSLNVRLVPALFLVVISFLGACSYVADLCLKSHQYQLAGSKAACRGCKCRCESLASCLSGSLPLTGI